MSSPADEDVSTAARFKAEVVQYLREKALTYFGALWALPLVTVVVYSVFLLVPCDESEYSERNRIIQRSTELACTTLAAIVCIVYVWLSLYLDRKVQKSEVVNKMNFRQWLKKILRAGVGSTNLIFYIVFPYTFYALASILARGVLIGQLLDGTRVDKDPVPTVYLISGTEQRINLAVEFMILVDICVQFIMVVQSLAVQLRIPDLHMFFKRTLDFCIGYMFTYNLLQFVVELMDTWSTSYLRADNTLVSGSISFRFFTLCAVLNLAFFTRFQKDGNFFLLNANAVVQLPEAVRKNETLAKVNKDAAPEFVDPHMMSSA